MLCGTHFGPGCIWKSAKSIPWATRPHSALLQGEAEVETLESCQRHVERAASPVSLSVPEMVQMTVQSYTRSLQEFSESSVMPRCNSLSSSHWLTGAPQSITEWLVLWEKDPVEILLDLGFGTEEPDVCTKIPPRFLSGASAAKGINTQVFLEAQKQRMDTERPNFYERFRQLEVLDQVTSALSSLLTDVNTQQIKAQDTSREETGLLDAAGSRPVVTQAERRIGQLLKRASQQTALLQQGSWAPGEDNLLNSKEQPRPCADIAERGMVQAGFSACVTLGYLTQEQTPRDKGASAYPMSHCLLPPLGKAWALSHTLANQPHLSPACEVPAKDRPRQETPLLVAHMLKNVADLNCKSPDSFEMEEIQSFEDETPCGNAPDTASAEVMVTRTSSCQSDSSGFMEELPEPAVLQNASLLGKINFISDIHNQETALSHRTEFPMLNQDFQQKPDDGVAKVFITACESISTVPGLTKAGSDQGEETHLLRTAENGEYEACNAEPQSFVQEMLCDMDRKEDKTGRKQLEEEECIKEHSSCFQSGTQDEGDPSSSKFNHNLYFRTGHKKVNFTDLIDINPGVISEPKIRGKDEGERYLTKKDVGVACPESAHCIGPWWGVEVVSKDGNLLAKNEVTNRQKFCRTDGDSKNTICSPKTELPETPQWGSAAQSRSSDASSCSPQVSQRHPSCLAEGSGLSSLEDQEAGRIAEVLGANKSGQEEAARNNEMASAPLKSVTVQMSSGLEFTSRVKCTGQNAPFSETLAREDPADFCEDDLLIQSDPRALKDGVKQTTEASSQTNIHPRKPRWPPLLHPPHTPLTKSVSLDTVLCGKDSSRCWDEASGAGGAQGNHCCHCCCCCCPWTFPVAGCPQCPMGCCSNHATTELQLLKTLMLLQDAAMRSLTPCTLREIEAMKSSCRHFQEKLDEIEQHLTEQQERFASTMTDKGREEGRHLQLLRQAVRQEAGELELQLNEQACQVREGILMQLGQLLVEQSHLFSELGLSDWKGERKAWNKQAFPDAADMVHPQNGCSKMVHQRAPHKNTTATNSLSALNSGAPPMQCPTRITPGPNSAKSDPQEISTSKKETEGPRQAKLDLKALLHNLKKSSDSLGNDSSEGKD
ncbi:LOW QUALITY PROTEIN: protein ITPRID1 [Pterocles gutturalis]